MTDEAALSFAKRRFCAGSEYELVVFDRLPPGEQAMMAELCADEDFYGILRPREGSGHTFRAVDKNTALLWLTLQSPGNLPSFVWRGEPETAIKAVWALVLDGVLQVEEGGRFVSGAAACEARGSPGTKTPQGRLARLSCDALRYGEALSFDDPQQLAARLYAYGRQPITPEWECRLGDGKRVLHFLGADSADLGHHLEADWERLVAAQDHGWLAWSSPKRQEFDASSPTYKLYISPRVEGLPAAFACVVDVLSRRGGSRFKVGSDASGLLRPDKLVLYFGSLEHLLLVATDLAPLLFGLPCHGVPFTADIAHDGLLSWGMDPPLSDRTLAWQEPESWRLWVVRRLAVAMVAARRCDGTTVPPWQFALERLRHARVDVDHWTPSAALWQAPQIGA